MSRPTQHQFRHALLDDLARYGFDGTKLNEAHLKLGAYFTAGDFEGAVAYAKTLGLSRRDVDRAWFGN